MVFVSLLAGSIVDKVGHARLMSFGALLMALSIAAFSSAIYLDSNLAIILLAIILRILQGKQIDTTIELPTDYQNTFFIPSLFFCAQVQPQP